MDIQTKRKIYILMLVIIVFLTACSNKDTSDLPKTQESQGETKEKETIEEDHKNPLIGKTILTIDNEDISYSETILYLKYIQSYYENTFGEKIWDYNLGDDLTIGELAKQDIIDTIIERKITKKQWMDYEVEITEEDEDFLKEEVNTYLKKLTKEDKEYYGITEEVVYQFFFDNLMAERVYDAATMSVDTQVSDEEAKQITIQYLLIATTNVDNEGNRVSISEEDKKAAYAKAQDLLSQATSADDFYSFAKSNTDSAEVEKVIGKKDVEPAFEKAAFALKSGELSSIVEGDQGYLIIYCVEDYNEDATLDKKEKIIDERQSKMFQEVFEEWKKEVKVKLNNKLWDDIQFDN